MWPVTTYYYYYYYRLTQHDILTSRHDFNVFRSSAKHRASTCLQTCSHRIGGPTNMAATK